MSQDLDASPAIAESPAPVSTEADAKPDTAPGADPAPAVAKPDVAPEDKVQKRFDKLTREKYEAFRERDRLRWELEQLRSQPAKTPPVAQEPPTLESSGFDEAKYRQALKEFFAEEARSEARRVVEETRGQEKAEAAESEFQKREREFSKSKPDYVERVMDNPDLPITQAMAKVIHASEIGPQIAYYLAEHEDIAASIASMPEYLQAREIGRLEARLETQKPAPKPPVSQAPPPPPKLEATDPGVDKSPEEMTQATDAQFAKWRKKYMNKR